MSPMDKPSQPSNFVSILHLRERWLQGNEQNQGHKQPEQQVQQVWPTRHEGNIDQKPEDVKPLVQKPRIHTTTPWSSHRSRKFPMYYRAVPVSSRPCNVNEPCKKSVDEGEPLLAVPLIESDETKRKSKKKLRQKKPRSQNVDDGKPLRAVPHIESDEKKIISQNKSISQSEDTCKPLLAVLPMESAEKKIKSQKKPISQEDKGQPILAVPPIECNEKKKISKKKNLQKKAISQSKDEGEPLLAVPSVISNKMKNKSKKKRRPKKPISLSGEMNRTSRTPEENLKVEMRERDCKVGEQNDKKDGRTSQTFDENSKNGMRGKEPKVGEQNTEKYVGAGARRIDEKEGIESPCGSETGNMNEIKEIVSKLSHISVSFDNRRGRNNGVYKCSRQGTPIIRDHRNLHRLAPQKLMDAGMIWVRKDELPTGA